MSASLKDIRHRATSALNKVPPGPLGTELADAVFRKSVTQAFEAALLERGPDRRLFVYLTQRAANDTAYPGQYHMPGSVRRPGEKWADVMDRLSEKEFGAQIFNRRKVGEVLVDEARGSFDSFINLVDIAGHVDLAKMYPVDDLPEPMVEPHQQMLIPLAIAAFEVEEAENVLRQKKTRLEELKAKFCDE